MLVCPVLDLKTYPDTMEPRLSTALRRAQNKLSHSGLQLEIANHANLTRCLQDFFGLHERRWGALESARRGFLEDAAVEFLAAGLLRLAVLRVDGVAAASVYAFTTLCVHDKLHPLLPTSCGTPNPSSIYGERRTESTTSCGSAPMTAKCKAKVKSLQTR
jgi:hypothetical protein